MSKWTTCALAVDEAVRRAHQRAGGKLEAVDAMLTEVCTERGLNKDVVVQTLDETEGEQ